eukprot:1366591-Karenia_brevis.AAC.1
MSSYKQVLRTAAAETRDNLFKQTSMNNGAVDCILTSCSRAVFTQDVSFAKFLCQKHSLAKKHLKIDDAVHFVSAPQFSLELAQARHAHLSENIQRNERRSASLPANSTTRSKCISRIQHLSSLLRQWVPISKFVTITALIAYDVNGNEQGNRTLITDPETVLLKMIRHWSPFLDGSATEFDSELAERLLDDLKLNTSWNWSRIRFPHYGTFKRVAANSSQKGFISGRHFTDNLLTIDTTMRVYSNLHQKYGQAVAAFFDFSNAFPSITLQWIFLVIRWLKLPQG